MCHFKYNLLQTCRYRAAFTMVEIVAALAVLGMMLTSVMVLVNRGAEFVMDLQTRQHAFELARSNMETLLSETRLSEMSDFGTSEIYPDVEWETIVEPFYEPVTNRMWIRAVCSAGYTDRKGEYQAVELEHWITNLNATQVKQILAQQEVEQEYLNLLEGGEDSAIQETTRAYLESQGLDAEAYERFIKKQQRDKLEYITEKGFDGYDAFLEQLKEEENTFLEELGMDFESYNDFAATYVPKSYAEDDMLSALDDTIDPADAKDSILDESQDSTTAGTSETPQSNQPDFDWSKVPPELIPLIEQLLGQKKP